MQTASSILAHIGLTPRRFAIRVAVGTAAFLALHALWTAESALPVLAVFGMAMGLCMFVAVVLVAETIRLHYEEEARLAQRMAAIEAAISKAPKRVRPVVPVRAPSPPSPPVTPPGFLLTHDGTLIRKAG